MENDDANDGMTNLLQQLQGMQSKFQDMEQTMGDRKVEAEAGNSLVTVQADGRLRLLSVRIAPEAIDPKEPELLEDLILTAVNRALDKARGEMAQEMTSGLFGGKLPGMF